MDLLATLRNKINCLPSGDYLPGMLSVLSHIEASYRHIARGQSNKDESAYNDAIYRANQSFEGSVKEAFRVLAGKDPSHETPHKIEKYLSDNAILKPRVLAEFMRYRKEWRNPSTHNYTLLFDSSEAFLAITTVSAFACVLIDQIAEKVGYESSKSSTNKIRVIQINAANEPEIVEATPEIRQQLIVDIVLLLLSTFNHRDQSAPILSDSQLIGSIMGFITTVTPDLKIERDVRVSEARQEMAKLVVSIGGERVLVDARLSSTLGTFRLASLELEHLMGLAGAKSSVLYFYDPNKSAMTEMRRPFRDGYLHVLANVKPGLGRIIRPLEPDD